MDGWMDGWVAKQAEMTSGGTGSRLADAQAGQSSAGWQHSAPRSGSSQRRQAAPCGGGGAAQLELALPLAPPLLPPPPPAFADTRSTKTESSSSKLNISPARIGLG